MKLPILIFPSLLVALVFQAGGQTVEPTPRPTPPPGPLIQKRAPGFSSWVISVQLPGAAAPKSSDETSVENGEQADKINAEESKKETPKLSVTKTGKVYHVRLVDGQKQIWDVWSDGTVTAAEPRKGENAEFVAPPGDRDSINPLYVNFSKSDFDGFNWISTTNFQGIRKVMGRQCLVFSDKVVTGTLSSDPHAKSPSSPEFTYDNMVACVDAETRLPVVLTNANGITTYKFLTPPGAMQTLPQSIIALVEKQRQLSKSLARKPGKPF
jgi:hypothetical protein